MAVVQMISLNTVQPGRSVRVLRLEALPELCHRLRELGFHENSVVRCLQSGTSCVCMIRQARIGLSGQLARQIVVEPIS